MVKQEKIKRDKQATSLHSMEFNRFLWFRYTTAIFFFTNLYWAILLAGSRNVYWILPAVLTISATMVSVEQTRKYWHPTHDLPVTRWAYMVQLIANVVLLLGLATGFTKTLLPFISTSGMATMTWLLTMGTLLSLWVLRRVYLVEHDQDRYLTRLHSFAASLH